MRTGLLIVLCLAGTAMAADDGRQLVRLPPAAESTLRAEMRANMLAVNDILALVAAGKLEEAGARAEQDLGQAMMGRHRSLPFDARPGPHMPPAMHQLGIDGHRAASAFARVAASGDREKTIAALPTLTQSCVACHYAYRLR